MSGVRGRSAPVPTARLLVRAAAAAIAVTLPTACGVPGDGSVQRVDDDAVPYRLLEPGPPSPSSSAREGEPGNVPVVFWLDGHRLVPEAAGDSCTEPTDVLVERLLGALEAGPSDDARAAGRSSAIPPDSGLELVGIADGTVEVDIESETTLSAERLPVAVGQVVLTITSTPSIRTVVLLSDGEPVQVPLPGGALTDGPVTAEDYADLLPDRYQGPGTFGCTST